PAQVVGDPRGHVAAGGDHRAVGGAHHRVLHLQAQRPEAAVHDLVGDRIDHHPSSMTIDPSASTCHVWPGSTNVVESYSWMIAGPAVATPGAHGARWYRGVEMTPVDSNQASTYRWTAGACVPAW